MFLQLKTAILVLFVVWSPFVLSEVDQLLQARTLSFPEVGADDDCPVSIGNHDVIPHDAKNIFCAACAWHGGGPVYLSFAWARSAEQQDARFVLSDVRNVTAGVYTVKTPVVAEPDYEGPILIRGERLGVGTAEYTLFPGTTTETMEKLQARPNNSRWSFWGWGMKMSTSGCYGIQIDTVDSTSVVVFEVLE